MFTDCLYYLNAEGGFKINKDDVAKHLKKPQKVKNERQYSKQKIISGKTDKVSYWADY